MGFPKSAKRAAQRVVFTRERQTIAGVTPDETLDELTRIQQRDGDLTAKAVVNESRPNEAPLHPIFEWDDEVAGERYREHQATNLIRSVRVVEEAPTEPIEVKSVTVTTPAFVNVSPVGTPGVYKNPTEVAESVSYLAIATENAVRQVAAAQRALEDLRRIADERGDDRASLIVAALSSIEVAREAVARFQ